MACINFVMLNCHIPRAIKIQGLFCLRTAHNITVIMFTWWTINIWCILSNFQGVINFMCLLSMPCMWTTVSIRIECPSQYIIRASKVVVALPLTHECRVIKSWPKSRILQKSALSLSWSTVEHCHCP